MNTVLFVDLGAGDFHPCFLSGYVLTGDESPCKSCSEYDSCPDPDLSVDLEEGAF